MDGGVLASRRAGGVGRAAPAPEPVLRIDDDAGVRAAYAAHGAELYRFTLRLLDDRGLAEEVVQETFLRAWRAAEHYDPLIGSLRTWLFAIARNAATDAVRARAVRPGPPVLGQREEAAAGDHAERMARSWQVEEALGRLRPEHRRVLLDCYFRDRPRAEVAAELGVPEGTVRSRVFYALKALRVALEEGGWSDGG